MNDDTLPEEVKDIDADVVQDAAPYDSKTALMDKLVNASSKEELLQILSAAKKSGDMNKYMAAHFRSDMGIHKSSFTKKSSTAKLRKSKQKLQKAARKKQR